MKRNGSASGGACPGRVNRRNLAVHTAGTSPAARWAHSSIFENLDLDVLEVDLGPLGLEAERALRQVHLAAGDGGAVDAARHKSVLDAGLGSVPLADLVAGLFQGGAVELVVFHLGVDAD